MSKLAEFSPAPLCLMGDFNSGMDPSLDRLNTHTQGPTKLVQWATSMFLQDAWRWKHPSQQSFSCHSQTHKSLSRIDQALTTLDILPILDQITYLPQAISDHFPLLLTLRWLPPTTHRSWRLSPLWFKNPEVEAKNAEAYKEYWATNVNTASPNTLWDASKAVMRGTLAHAIAQARNNAKAQVRQAEEELTQAEREHILSPLDLSYNKLLQAKNTLEREETSLTKKAILYQSQRTFEKGDKNGKLLAFLAKAQSSPSAVARIQTSTGAWVTDPPSHSTRICNATLHLYGKLYSYSTLPIFRYYYNTNTISRLPSTLRLPNIYPRNRTGHSRPTLRQNPRPRWTPIRVV
uniref:Endonuclease/exonuclease/phosphatase domain-containing protein n=1 Tax=Xenopus tropicalis TaxID=8364 RepID=A0A803JA94_XENTR